MKIPYTPIKVIDTFLESPELWRLFALKQEFENNKTVLLSQINPDLFSSFASKLIKHCHGATGFQHLEVYFEKVSTEYQEIIDQGNLSFNIMGLIFLDESSLKNTGIEFHNPTSAKITMTVQNEYNRCVMFHPREWHKNLKSSDTKLVIKFSGIVS